METYMGEQLTSAADTAREYGLTIFPFLSVFCLFIGAALFLATRKSGRLSRSLLVLTAFSVFAILFMELDTVWQTRILEKTGFWKRIWQFISMPDGILPKTMQAFSLDAQYDSIIKSGPRLLMWYKAVLYTLAPIIGGAVIYDVLAGVSPYLRLFFKQLKCLYVFSELNEKSLALAQSIAGNYEKRKAPVLIFADCPQLDTELAQRSRELGAICLPDSLDNCSMLHMAKQCVFFLMNCDENREISDVSNLRLLRELLNAEKPLWPAEKGCQIFCFSNQESSAENIRAIRSDFCASRKETGAEKVALHVVREYVQCACALMAKHPLFVGLDGKESGAPLRVLIVGNNGLSRELYKTVFWCGQILDHPLQLTAAYMPTEADSEREMERWLIRNCPELCESCTPGDPCLRLSFDGSCADPYASLCFIEEDQNQLFSPAFLTEKRKNTYGSTEEFALSDCDYFILATGNDNDNIKLADALWRELVYLKWSGDVSGEKTIAAVVENSALFEIQRLHSEELLKEESSVTMIAFGSTAERFHWENVFVKDTFPAENRPERTVAEALHGLEDIPASLEKIYDEWSTLARRAHLPYRMFTALCHREAAKQKWNTLPAPVREKFAYCEAVETDGVLCEQLAWMEHRRWNAFVRTEGFRRPPNLEERLREMEEGRCTADRKELELCAYKNVLFRLHPNLVECFRGREEKAHDLLDAASAMRQYANLVIKGKETTVDLKKYDYPSEKYGPRLSREELIACLTDAAPAEADFDLNRAWTALEQKYPAVKECEDTDHSGHYYAGRVLKLLMNKRT